MSVFRILPFISAIFCVISLFISSVPGQAKANVRNLLNIKVEKISSSDKNVPMLLSEVAYEYHVPIGIEVSKDEDLLKPDIFAFSNGTIKNFLDLIVKQSGLYFWELREGVINVRPIESHRDWFLKEVMETQITNFSVMNGASTLSFRESLTRSAGVNDLMRKYKITAENEAFTGRDYAIFGRGFTLNAERQSVQTVLNTVIRESQTKFWIVNRYGKDRKFLLINF